MSLTAKEAYSEFIGIEIVLDVNSPMIFVGKLLDADEYFVSLENVDVHELVPGGATKEIYAMEASRSGIQPNRKMIKVKQSEVISISKLTDVVVY